MIKKLKEFGLPAANTINASELYGGNGLELFRNADAHKDVFVATVFSESSAIDALGEEGKNAPIQDGDLMFESPEDYWKKCRSDFYSTYPSQRLEVMGV